jgi:hypothetical protein
MHLARDREVNSMALSEFQCNSGRFDTLRNHRSRAFDLTQRKSGS